MKKKKFKIDTKDKNNLFNKPLTSVTFSEPRPRFDPGMNSSFWRSVLRNNKESQSGDAPQEETPSSLN